VSEIDARPSDGDLLALQMDRADLVAPEVWEQAAILKVGQEFQPVWNDQLPGAEIKEMEWRSLSLTAAERGAGASLRAPDNSGAAAVTLPSRRCWRVPHPASMDPCRRLAKSGRPPQKPPTIGAISLMMSPPLFSR